MTEKDIEKMLAECDGLDMSHISKDDALAKAKREMHFGSAKEAEKEEKTSIMRSLTVRRLVPTLAGVALAVAIFAGSIGLYNENFQTVYIDINPSVALKLNRFERVIGVEYLNEDAKELLSGVKLVGCDATEALSVVIEACNSAGYVQDDSEIYISATSKDEQKSEKLLEKLKGHTEGMKADEGETYAVNTYNAKKADKERYEKSSVSPAKYDIIEDIIDEDGEYTFASLKDKSMGELRKILREVEDFDDDDRDDDDDRNDRNDREDHYGDHDDDRDDDREDNNHSGDREEEKENSKQPNRDDNDDDDDDDDDDDKGDKDGKPLKKDD